MSNDAAAVFNERLLYPTYEIIGGVKIMAPSATLFHSNAIGEIYTDFKNYFRQNKKGYVFTDNVDVHFSDGSVYKPDLVVVSEENKNIMSTNKAIYGAPDLVVEVLSRSTRKNDLTVKKDTYEKFGVKEYWIIDPYMEVIDVYILRAGKYELDFEYICYDERDLEEIADFKEEEKPEIKNEISPSIFPELKIKLRDIFSWSHR